MGLISAEIPMITKKLNRLLPITLPIAIPAEPSMLAKILTASSGADVPTETMVRPIIRSDTFIFFAMEEAPFTR
jgi:hypothetical protein